jgi:hypothetical protein
MPGLVSVTWVLGLGLGRGDERQSRTVSGLGRGFGPVDRKRAILGKRADPVAGGFVDSLAKPGGNITGSALFEYSIGAK